ncbi:(2Fe-2S) ferredoxin [Arenicella chitinivorans]|uniref:(2Fe-2S) ferredoxin n=1 Tax=Arenicella chitinivorans TaxID=1329800 RepID=A0A918VQZ7_9GAMM|nr:2Fe-2S iron-sulfur cluster-binding protein [Arenicella chitinivorans]GHA20682.1 (2Fe-2S) ferredoxin [Arenicella chitinivorans]
MPLIKYVEHNGTEHQIQVSNGQSVMEGAIDNMVDGIAGECGGSCSCATCHCYVHEDWVAKVGGPNEIEEGVLECAADPRANSRLSCQITVTDELDGLVILLPESQY